MIETRRLKNVVILIQIIKMKMDVPQPEAQVEIDPDLLALSKFEKEKLIHNYYSDMKSRGRGKFDIYFFSTIIMPRQFKSKESVKLIWMQAKSKVMQGCFYCGKCESCNKFLEIENECKAKVLLNFNKDMKNWEVAYRGKNKHFKITPQEADFSFFCFS